MSEEEPASHAFRKLLGPSVARMSRLLDTPIKRGGYLGHMSCREETSLFHLHVVYCVGADCTCFQLGFSPLQLFATFRWRETFPFIKLHQSLFTVESFSWVLVHFARISLAQALQRNAPETRATHSQLGCKATKKPRYARSALFGQNVQKIRQRRENNVQLLA